MKYNLRIVIEDPEEYSGLSDFNIGYAYPDGSKSLARIKEFIDSSITKGYVSIGPEYNRMVLPMHKVVKFHITKTWGSTCPEDEQ